jgi:hypothetical protein
MARRTKLAIAQAVSLQTRRWSDLGGAASHSNLAIRTGGSNGSWATTPSCGRFSPVQFMSRKSVRPIMNSVKLTEKYIAAIPSGRISCALWVRWWSVPKVS